MKQISKKLKLVMHYIPSGYYNKKDKARFFINCNEKKKDIYIDKKCNNKDLTMNELLNEIKYLLDEELQE